MRLTSAMRLVLAASALLIIYIDPSEPAHFVGLTDIALVLYTIYSAVVCDLAVRRSPLLPRKILHWLDVAWYVPLIALTGGNSSLFFFFFFFAILVASFGRGFSSGLWVTLVSTLAFTLVSYLTIPWDGNFELNRLLLLIDLLVIGFMIAYWGGSEIKSRARLGLLKEVSLLSNPRFGVDQTIHSIIESLRSFYHADACLLVLVKNSNGGGPYQLHRVDRNNAPGYAPSEMTEEMVRVFLGASSTQAAIYNKGMHGKTLLYDIRTGQLTKSGSGGFKLLNAFEGKSCLTVPVHNRNQMLGRLYVVGGARPFDYAEIDFVLQLIGQVIPVLENIRLVDRLASAAAEQERKRIAQDIHDSVIQPYIGLQFGLAAVSQKLKAGNMDVMNEIRDLMELTDGEIAELRRYVGGLRRGESPQNPFLPAVRRFASKFSEATGLHIDVKASGDLPIYDRLGAELFQMIEEGLSNVRRHSSSSYAKVEISRQNGNLVLQLKNHRRVGLADASFTPRSIADRAAALGGQTVVFTDKNNDTVVSVQIPL